MYDFYLLKNRVGERRGVYLEIINTFLSKKENIFRSDIFARVKQIL